MTDYYVTDALADIALLDKSIPDKINRATFDMLSREVLVSAKLQAEVKEFIDNTKRGYQSLLDLIKRRHALKSAIIRSNAGIDNSYSVKTISVAGLNLTVAEIIERRKSLSLETTLLNRLKTVNLKMEKDLVEANKKYNADLLEYINAQATLKTVKKDDANHVDECTRQFAPTNQPIRLDPIYILKEIERLEEYVLSFNSELDRALSKHNATTLLVVK